MNNNIESQIRQLKISNAILAILVISLFLFAFGDRQNKRFTEISVEKINLIEKDGTIKMIIANKVLLPPPTLNNKTLVEVPNRGPGMIFYNEEGDEIGIPLWWQKWELHTFIY